MISITKLILEESGKHEYGAVILFFKFPELQKLQSKITKEDIYTGDGGDRSYGLEDNPHVTLLYGLHEEVTLDQVKNIVDQYTYTPLRLHTASTFNNPLYDVLKFDVGYVVKGGAFLQKANKALSKLPNTNSFPEYHPHATMGYLKPNTGKKYVSLLKGKEYTVTPEYIIYSTPEGIEHKIKINTK